MNNERKLKETDQDQVEEAFDLIFECMENNTQIEETLWASALWSAIVNGYINAGGSHEDFSKECKSVIKHYKTWWEDDR